MAGASRLVAYSSRKTGCGLSTISVEEKNLNFTHKLNLEQLLKFLTTLI